MNGNVKINTAPGRGAGIDLAQMEPVVLENFVAKTARFVQRAMQDPDLREKIQKRAEEIRTLGLYT